MDKNKQREEFEAWFNKEVFSLKLADSKLVNCYWQAWQAAQKAAIASIEIELPSDFINAEQNNKGLFEVSEDGMTGVVSVLTAAGLRVKP